MRYTLGSQHQFSSPNYRSALLPCESTARSSFIVQVFFSQHSFHGLRNEKNISKQIFFKPEIDEVIVVLIFRVKEHSQMTRVHSHPSHDVKQVN